MCFLASSLCVCRRWELFASCSLSVHAGCSGHRPGSSESSPWCFERNWHGRLQSSLPGRAAPISGVHPNWTPIHHHGMNFQLDPFSITLLWENCAHAEVYFLIVCICSRTGRMSGKRLWRWHRQSPVAMASSLILWRTSTSSSSPTFSADPSSSLQVLPFLSSQIMLIYPC